MECSFTVLILVIGLFIKRGLSFHNLAANGIAVQSGSYRDPNNVVYDASKALDGNKDQTWAGKSCGHTVPGRSTAWWRLDIGHVANIHRVVIYYRSERPDRLDGYYLFISNTFNSSNPNHGHECFHDPYDSRRINTTQDITCNTVGRYVVFYNERPATETLIELCEVDVFGCLLGRYGTNCEFECSQHCINKSCDIMTGTCTCKPGYKGATCTDECEDGMFGENCSNRCHCLNGVTCDNEIGTCPDGNCDPGWEPDTCSEVCSFGTYGMNCSQKCGKCKHIRDGCNHAHGKCTIKGCLPGWKGRRCHKKCDDGMFGDGCQQRCHCLNGVACDNVKGSCPNGDCNPGWKLNTCSAECDDGMFGDRCQQRCHCLNGVACDNVNGSCPNGGCNPGWKLITCSAECNDGTFGLGCQERCHCLKNASCDNVNGICPNGECDPGWKLNTCSEECDDGTFGLGCRERCYCLRGASCDNVNGKCSNGECDPGWKLNTCSEACESGTFGRNCQNKCSNCLTEQCNRFNGTCRPQGICKPGWKGIACDSECMNGAFGVNCSQSCSNCISEMCDHVNGVCTVRGSCKTGYFGSNCDQECLPGSFGDGCSDRCVGCVDDECEPENGTCVKDGCKPGYIGQRCALLATADDTRSTGTTVGVVIGVLALFVVALVVICYRRRQPGVNSESKGSTSLTNAGDVNRSNDRVQYVNVEKRRHRTPDINHTKHSFSVNNDTNHMENLYSNDIGEAANVYLNSELFDKTSKYSVAVKDLASIVEMKKQRAAFNDEYAILPMGSQHSHKEGQKEENKPKNRFLTTFPYDHSRVQLIQRSGNDYINANYIKNYSNDRAYIATQGPKKNTLNDFWQMVWQENVGKIVMVTKLKEGEKKKCEQYWPLSTRTSFNLEDFTIKMAMETERTIYTYRRIKLTCKQNQSQRTVHQYHFTQWPDHGVPDKTQLVNFHRKVKATYNQSKGPLLVHCSAGIGRTGTFIALDALYENGLKTGFVDIFHFTNLMRKDRINMIQTCDQYIMVHDALVEAFTVDDTAIPVRDYLDITDPVRQSNGQRQHSIHVEFQKLQELKPVYKEDKCVTGKRKENIVKNAIQSILPNDDYRPFLMSFGRSSNDYINAVIIPSFTPRINYIVTQCPLRGTVGDFWSMIYDNECKTVVLLEPIEKNVHLMPDQEGQEELYDNFVISRKRSATKEDNKILLSLKHKEKDNIKNVTLFINDGWSRGRMTPHSERNSVDFIGTISSDKNSMVILCRDGCTRCGVFVTLKLVMDQIQMDEEVDIFQVVRRMQTRRPEFIPTVEQYEYCYRSIKEYLKCDSLHDLYANM